MTPSELTFPRAKLNLRIRRLARPVESPMYHRISVAGKAASVLLIVSTLQVHAQDSGKGIVSPPIPFELVSDFLVVVKGRIGKLDGLSFILDTGTTNSVVDQKLANRLRLQTRKGTILNFDRRMPVEWANIPELQVGNLRATGLRVQVLNLAEYSEFAQKVDGIIGLDLLNRSRKLTIDYEQRIVSFQLAGDGTGERPLSGYHLVPLVVQGLPLRVLLDTGLQGILLYRARLREGLPNMRTEGKPANIAVMGRIQGVQAKLPGVQIGGGPEITVTVWLIDSSGDSPPGIDGYLGPTSLHAKRLEFDFGAKVMRWQ